MYYACIFMYLCGNIRFIIIQLLNAMLNINTAVYTEIVDVEMYVEIVSEIISAAVDRFSCGEKEFDCGNGQCIPLLSICDHTFNCLNGADELKW